MSIALPDYMTDGVPVKTYCMEQQGLHMPVTKHIILFLSLTTLNQLILKQFGSQI
jgi:hypothetical protein